MAEPAPTDGPIMSTRGVIAETTASDPIAEAHVIQMAGVPNGLVAMNDTLAQLDEAIEGLVEKLQPVLRDELAVAADPNVALEPGSPVARELASIDRRLQLIIDALHGMTGRVDL